MPSDLPNEQELLLKKRAHRRLVGAIALVLLMVIVLPQVLQDRAAITQQEAIKITMSDAVDEPNLEPATDKNSVALQEAEVLAPQQEVVVSVEPAIENIIANKDVENNKTEPKKSEISQVAASQNQSEYFTVQVGVYSDAANVKRLQDQLKQAGFNAYTEKIMTPKGESIRLKAGNFTSRQDAVNALGKLKAIGLSGVVIDND